MSPLGPLGSNSSCGVSSGIWKFLSVSADGLNDGGSFLRRGGMVAGVFFGCAARGRSSTDGTAAATRGGRRLGRAPAKERSGVTLAQAHAVELRPRTGVAVAALALLDASQSKVAQHGGVETATGPVREL